MTRRNFVGEKFGKLTVVSEASSICGRKRWNCRCECGNEKAIYASNLVSGGSKSCGCMRGRKQSKSPKKKKMTALDYYMQSVLRDSGL